MASDADLDACRIAVACLKEKEVMGMLKAVARTGGRRVISGSGGGRSLSYDFGDFSAKTWLRCLSERARAEGWVCLPRRRGRRLLVSTGINREAEACAIEVEEGPCDACGNPIEPEPEPVGGPWDC